MIVLYIAAAVAVVLVGLAAGLAILGISDDIRDELELDEHQAERNTRPHAHIKVIRK